MSTFLFRIPTSLSSPSPLRVLRVRAIKSEKASMRACLARDRIIDFGKYKGRMLGTLPSTYLKWISSNLRARDFEEWAKLADQVLEDDVYQDRVQWEFAQNILNGDVLTSPLSTSSSGASSFIEISQRFGWDNDDKLGWSRLDFELLGTSKGGRIPRITDKGPRTSDSCQEEDAKTPKSDADVGERRGERRERLQLKRRTTVRSNSSQRLLKVGIENKDSESRKSDDGGEEGYSRFPGRQGLLKRVMDAKGRRPSF